MYNAALGKETNNRGCTFHWPASHQEVHSRPGLGGTYPATGEKNWGDLAYIASLMETNATLDGEKYDQLCGAYGLAQLILRTELEANRFE